MSGHCDLTLASRDYGLHNPATTLAGSLYALCLDGAKAGLVFRLHRSEVEQKLKLKAVERPPLSAASSNSSDDADDRSSGQLARRHRSKAPTPPILPESMVEFDDFQADDDDASLCDFFIDDDLAEQWRADDDYDADEQEDVGSDTDSDVSSTQLSQAYNKMMSQESTDGHMLVDSDHEHPVTTARRSRRLQSKRRSAEEPISQVMQTLDQSQRDQSSQKAMVSGSTLLRSFKGEVRLTLCNRC